MASREVPGSFVAAYRLLRQSKPGHLGKLIWTDDKFRAQFESAPDAAVILEGSGKITVGYLETASSLWSLPAAAPVI